MTIIFLFLTTLLSSASELRPFESDGCTMAPDGTLRNRTKWRECCVAHDLRFWGGSKDHRLDADLKLKSCIEEKAGPAMARIFWLAVKTGSYSPIKLANKKWGNAWFDRSGYRSLSPEEIDQLIKVVLELEIDSELREDYIQELQVRD